MEKDQDAGADKILLDRYRLLGRIGSGGMGVVYEAEHVTLGTRHAVKMINKLQGFSDDEVRILIERAEREAKLAAKVQHPKLSEVENPRFIGAISTKLIAELFEHF